MRRLTPLSLICSCLPFLATGAAISTPNSTYTNPILPGFHPDPSCIHVASWDNTFFCASSSFLAFPGIPIHASKDLQNWKLIGNVFNRPEQLPMLATTKGQTSGIWAPALRYQNGVFYVVTTLVHDDRNATDPSRWDNILFSSKDPYNSSSWTEAIHFDFEGYDTSPFWDDDGQSYITGSHSWKVRPGIDQFTMNLETGKEGPHINTWNGTGGLAPEGPHLFKKDGYYYLMIAEGGTGLNHMETIARSKEINGPYQPNPANPFQTNANTTEFFQCVGHADLFQDDAGNWWGVALSTRSGPQAFNAPMGRETVLYPVTWSKGDWPVASRVHGTMNGWPLPAKNVDISGVGALISAPDDIDFAPGSQIPSHFLHWRFPRTESYTVSSPGHPNTLRLTPSVLNLTSDGTSATSDQTLLARRQIDTLFSYTVDLDFSPQQQEEEAGVTVFLTQAHHIDLGIVLLPSPDGPPAPYFRLRPINGTTTTIEPSLTPVPTTWQNQTITMEIQAVNFTHYSFSAGPAGHESQLVTIGYAAGSIVTWGFTGALVGVYATTNGAKTGGSVVYVSNWRYIGEGQYLN